MLVAVVLSCSFNDHTFFKGEEMERKEMTYSDITVEIAENSKIQMKFVEEVKRLLTSGGINRDDHNRGLLFGVALENIADTYLRGEKKTRAYKNLVRF